MRQDSAGGGDGGEGFNAVDRGDLCQWLLSRSLSSHEALSRPSFSRHGAVAAGRRHAVQADEGDLVGMASTSTKASVHQSLGGNTRGTEDNDTKRAR